MTVKMLSLPQIRVPLLIVEVSPDYNKIQISSLIIRSRKEFDVACYSTLESKVQKQVHLGIFSS